MEQQMVEVRPGEFVNPNALTRLATDVAGVCKEIVEATAVEIETRDGKRRHVRVEGWQAIANGFGCTASARDVERVYDEGEFKGFKAIGEVRRNSDGHLISQAEGFVGIDEVRWFGGELDKWNKTTRKYEKKKYLPAAEYASRAMAQTRAISRACRSAFAYIVVMINKELDTTPAEEVADGGAVDRERDVVPSEIAAETPTNGAPRTDWREVVCSYGRKTGNVRGKKLGDLADKTRVWLWDEVFSKMENVEEKDRATYDALKAWREEYDNANQ